MAIQRFIRWAGGKQAIVKTLIEHLPEKYEKLRLIEPFAGAASLFLNTNFNSYVLIDKNPHLISTYKNIQKNYLDVFNELEGLKSKHSREFYYSVREDFNEDHHSSIIQSARFIYLVQSSFNGIYRVNRKGAFNVPFGKLNAHFPNFENFKFLHEKLSTTILLNEDFSIVKKISNKNDFIYFDPPYMALNKTSFFQHYTSDRFSNVEQKKLAEIANFLSNNDIKIMISSPNLSIMNDLYKDWKITPVGVIRYVSCKKVRDTVSEIIIRNY